MMDRRISENEIRYVTDHLACFYSGATLGDYMVTGGAGTGGAETGGAGTGGAGISKPALLFPLSEMPLDENQVHTIGDIPVLFPCSGQKKWYSMEGKQIRFHHDILKSSFYLLSGYQEYMNRQRDAHGRYSWKSSIQYRLGITQTPVVNYYFRVILEAFEKFCQVNKLDFRIKPWESPLLFLSHDVDRIKKYSLRNLIYAGLQVLGMKPSPRSFPGRVRNVLDYARGTLLFRGDPYWSFKELMDLEKQLNISSTWYFLEKTKKDNSRYHFADTRIRELIATLAEHGHEIGIHGSLESSDDLQALAGGIQRLNAVCDHPVTGNRQHYLKYDHPFTSKLLADSGLLYDATLGFAEHIGFRNSYAHPFRLFDFERQQPIDLWELPLNVMDVTLLGYMMVPVESIPGVIGPVVQEAKRFNGVFSLLWHNCNLDEEEFPGIIEVYRRVLNELMDSGFTSMTGDRIIASFKSSGA